MNDQLPPTESDLVLVDVKAQPSGWPPASLEPRLRASSPGSKRDAGPQPKTTRLKSLRFQGIAGQARRMAGTRLEHVRANVADLQSAVEWYTTVLGFEVESYWPPDAPNYAHFVTQSGATFAVMEAAGRGGRFNFTVDDPDALWNDVKDLAVVVEPLFDTPYGTRKFTIADPDGNELGFVRND